MGGLLDEIWEPVGLSLVTFAQLSAAGQEMCRE